MRAIHCQVLTVTSHRSVAIWKRNLGDGVGWGGVGWGGVLYKPNLLYQIMKTWHFHYFRSRLQGSMPYSSATASKLAPLVRTHSTGSSKCSNRLVNVSQHSGNYMYRQVSHSAILRSAHTVYLFCVDLRTNSDYFSIHQLNGFYNRDGVCLLRSPD